MRYFLPFVFFLALTVCQVHGDTRSTDPPIYEVNRAEIAPTIDGLVSAGEWDSAAAAGNWVDLIAHNRDPNNSRFRMLWDDTNLYILGETDFSSFGAPKDFRSADPAADASVYNPRMFFDPNVDGEDWTSAEFNPAEPDGYAISWSVSEGFAARRPTPGNPSQDLRDPLDETGSIFVDYIPGFELEAHVNSLAGNNGGWDISEEPGENYRDMKYPGIVFSQLAIDTPLDPSEQPGGVFEFAIAWEEFNATDPNSGDPAFDPASPDFLENGLYHPMAPEDGDIWAFEIGVREPGGSLPSWSEPRRGNADREEFAAWQAQHGRLVFIGQMPSITVEKSADLTSLDAPGTVTYSYLVTNTGDVTITGLSLSDDNDNDDTSCVETTILAGDSTTCTATHTFTQAELDAGGSLDNTVIASSNEAPDATDELSIPIVQNPSITVEKSADVESLNAPGTVTYTYLVTNTGNVTITGLSLSDDNDNDDAACFATTVLVGGRTLCSATHTFTQAELDAGGSLDNTVIASSNEAPDATDELSIPITAAFPEFDCNLSGEVDADDLTCMTIETRDPTLEILNLLVGDMNANGAVDFPDFLVLSTNFNTAVDNYTQGDLNIDGTVGFPDFLQLSINFGRRSEAGVAASVPEPGSAMLLLLGLVGLLRFRSRS